MTKTAINRRWVGATMALLSGVVLSGCHIDMWNQPKMKPFYQSDFFADQSADRPLVEHTVPIGPIQDAEPAYYSGLVNGKPVATIPAKAVKSFASPKEMLLRGQNRYNAYCAPCHGKTGDGNGFIMQRGLGYWQKLAASYHTARLRKIEDGHIYDVLTNGYGVMYSYGSRIQDVNDRWAIVSYIRALQLTRADQAPASDPYATTAGIAAGAQEAPIAPPVSGTEVSQPVPTPIAPASPLVPRVEAPHVGGRPAPAATAAPDETTATSPAAGAAPDAGATKP